MAYSKAEFDQDEIFGAILRNLEIPIKATGFSTPKGKLTIIGDTQDVTIDRNYIVRYYRDNNIVWVRKTSATSFGRSRLYRIDCTHVSTDDLVIAIKHICELAIDNFKDNHDLERLDSHGDDRI